MEVAENTDLSNRWSQEFPELGTGPVSVTPYISPEYFELEREKIFRRAWLKVGRVQDIPKPGDYFRIDIQILDASILVIRGKDGVIRAFHNVCKHRGDRLVHNESGNARALRCRFHNFVYDLEGNLADVPSKDFFCKMSKDVSALTPVAVDVWNGFIFINADPAPRETLAEFLGEFNDFFHDYPFDEMELAGSWSTVAKANWKTVLDGFHEGLHVEALHSKSARDAILDESGHAVPPWIGAFKRHRGISTKFNPNYVPTPAEAIAFQYGRSSFFGNRHKMDYPKGMNPSGAEPWAFDIFVTFPHFRFNPGPGFYFVDSFWPISVDETFYDLKLYVLKPETAAHKLAMEFTRASFRDVIREDMSTCENVHAGMKSGAITHLELSDLEILIRHSLKVVDDYIHEA